MAADACVISLRVAEDPSSALRAPSPRWRGARGSKRGTVIPGCLLRGVNLDFSAPSLALPVHWTAGRLGGTSTSSVERLRRAQSSGFDELSRASLALPVHSTAGAARQEARPPSAIDGWRGSPGGSPSQCNRRLAARREPRPPGITKGHFVVHLSHHVPKRLLKPLAERELSTYADVLSHLNRRRRRCSPA